MLFLPLLKLLQTFYSIFNSCRLFSTFCFFSSTLRTNSHYLKLLFILFFLFQTLIGFFHNFKHFIFLPTSITGSEYLKRTPRGFYMLLSTLFNSFMLSFTLPGCLHTFQQVHTTDDEGKLVCLPRSQRDNITTLLVSYFSTGTDTLHTF